MNGRIVFRILLALVLVAVAAGLGAFIYNAGVAHGLAAGGTAVGPNGGAGPVVPYAPYFFYRPWGFGFFPFGFIFPLLFFFLIFALIRGAFFRGWHNRGWGGPGQVPPGFEEWHRKMHENQPDESDR
jgi:hypothetical protein